MFDNNAPLSRLYQIVSSGLRQDALVTRRLFSAPLLLSVLAAALMLGLLAMAVAGRADTTFTVDSTGDAVDVAPGDGACATAGGSCTLRAAIQETNALPGTDAIFLPAGVYTLTIAGANENAAATGDLDIHDGLSITGAGPDASIVNGNGLDRVFQVGGAGPVQGVVNITGLGIHGGSDSQGGGAIYNGAHLTLDDAAVYANNSSFTGGGLFNAGVMTVTNALIRGNGAAGSGGIQNLDSLTVIDSIVVGNRSDGFAGGIGNNGVMTVTNSAIVENFAASHGGGIRTYDPSAAGARATITNSTISGNRTDGDGGGIVVHNFFDASALSLHNVTIAENRADKDDNGAGNGGGIFVALGASVATQNTIVADNVDLGGEAPDCAGPLASLGYNLLADDDGCTFSSATGDLVNISPQLFPFADYGGPTYTYALRAASFAIDAGNPAGCTGPNGVLLSTDQRGLPRRVDGDGLGDARCDIGAFEANLAIFTVNSTADVVDDEPGDLRCDTGNTVGQEPECTLRAAVQEANAKAAADIIILPAGAYPLSIPGAGENSAATGDLDIFGMLTIAGDGAATTVVDGAGLDRVFHIHGSLIGLFTSVHIEGLTVQNGDAGADDGGGIYNNGELAITGASIINSTATDGGGIANFGSLTFDDSSVHANSAGDDGGGIFNNGQLHLYGSVVNNNSAVGITGAGGGIYNESSSLLLNASTVTENTGIYGGGISNGDTMSITNSTISANTALGYGGGINNGFGTLLVRNSTVSGNNSHGNSGGIETSSGVLTLNNVTITGNTTDFDENGSGDGGGIALAENSATDIQNTIIAGNVDAGGEAPDCSGPLLSLGYNILGDDTGCDFTAVTGDQVGSAGAPIDPLLGPLQNNGGATDTHALLAGSPAIDGGDDDTCEPVDQRAAPRPEDGDDDGHAQCDVGAFEKGGQLPTPTPTPTTTVTPGPSPTPSPTPTRVPDAEMDLYLPAIFGH